VHGYRITLWAYAVPAIGAIRLQRVSAADLDAIYRTMATRGLSPRTIRYLYTILRKAFADAERQGLVPVNVVPRSTPPSTTAAKGPTMPVWTWDDLAAFLDHVDGRPLAAAITFAALTGCRRAEVVGLRWADVDLDARQMVVAHAVVDVGGQLVAGSTKTHRSRPVGLDDDLVGLLRRHRVAQNEWRLSVGAHWVDRDLVFPGPDGDHLDPARLSAAFKRYVADAGVPPIRFHDLRHSHASLLVDAGQNPKLVSERLGHATVGFTLDRYVKVSTVAQIDAANDFAARLRRRS
jgi:integrase